MSTISEIIGIGSFTNVDNIYGTIHNNSATVHADILSTGNYTTTTTVGSIEAAVTSIANQIWIYFGFIVFVVGFVGNLFILAVASRKCMRGTSSANYLMIMASAHLILLVVGIVPGWLAAMQIVVYDELTPATCKVDKFCKYAFGDVAIWIIVLFTIDRCFAICNPLQKSSRCLPASVKYYSLGAVVLAVAKNLHVFWTRGAEYTDTWSSSVDGKNSTVAPPNITAVSTLVTNCGYPTPASKQFEYYVRPWIALALANAIPCVVICVCNFLLVRAMVRMRRIPIRNSSGSFTRNSHVLQTSAMCLAGSIAFLVCISPSIVLTIGKPYWTVQPNPRYDIVKAVNNVFYYVNYSINFFLYCLTGRKFRNTLTSMFSCKKTGQDRMPLSVTTSNRTSCGSSASRQLSVLTTSGESMA